MDINNLTRLNNDAQKIEYSMDNANKISEYILTNFKNENDTAAVKKLSLERPSFYYNSGVGKLSQETKETAIERTNKLTNLNRIFQLAPRMHATIPLMTRGGCDTSIENKIRFIENTKLTKKSHSIDRFVPQLEKIKQMQNPIHLIPEDTDSNWKRGGQSSRLIVKDADYSKRCKTDG